MRIFFGIVLLNLCLVLSLYAQELQIQPTDESYNEAIEKLSQFSPSEAIQSAAIQYKISRGNTVKAKKQLVKSGLGFLPDEAEKKYSNAVKQEKNQIDKLLTAASTLPPKYSQPAFQCLGDFDLCVADNNMIIGCGIYLAICLAERLKP